MNIGFDYINGVKVPQLVITEDYIIQGKHQGTVHVKSGKLIIQGELNGTLSVHSGGEVEIIGRQNGTVSVDEGARITIYGKLNGTTHVNHGAVMIIEELGRLVGEVTNNGEIVIRGILGGRQSGSGKLLVEGKGQIKQPIMRNGAYYCEW